MANKKNRNNKRNSNKRKSNKRKSNRRKSNKRKSNKRKSRNRRSRRNIKRRRPSNRAVTPSTNRSTPPKRETRPQNTKKNPLKTKPIAWSKLLSSMVKSLIELILLFILGSRVLFATKIAQFNILPTDIHCMPYTPAYGKKKSPEFESYSPEANIDVIDIGDVTYATRILYEINDKTTKSKMLDLIRKIEYSPKVGTFVKYIMTCLSQLFVFFYGITTLVFGKMNEYMNESSIIVLGPIVLVLFFLICIPLSVITSFIICITNLGWLLKRNMNTDSDYKHKNIEKPVWRSIGVLSNIPNFLGTMVYLFLGVAFAVNFSLTPVPILIGLVCFLSPLFMSAIVSSGDKTDPPSYGFTSSIRGLIETKLTLFLFLFGISVISATAKHGNTPAVVMVALATMYFLYKQYVAPKAIPKTAVSNLAEYRQNAKFCPKPKMTKAEAIQAERDRLELAEREKGYFERGQDAVEDFIAGNDMTTENILANMNKELAGPEQNNEIISPIDIPEPRNVSVVPEVAQQPVSVTETATPEPPVVAKEAMSPPSSGEAMESATSPPVLENAAPNAASGMVSEAPATSTSSVSDAKQTGGGRSENKLLHRLNKLKRTLKRTRSYDV